MRTAVAAVALAVAVTITGCTGQHSDPITSPVAHAIPTPTVQFAGVVATFPAVKADEGVATVSGHKLFRGFGVLQSGSVLNHVGDPDSFDGYVLDAYQADPSADVKVFRWTSPTGESTDWTHPLAAGEMFNNSFAAISPNGEWFVSGEWAAERRLLVFATPTVAGPQTIGLAGAITLDSTVTDLQGCDFANATRLICTSDPDPDLIEVDLSHPLNGQPVTGAVRRLSLIPPEGKCSTDGLFESEGVDVTGTVLTVMVNPPGRCRSTTLEYRYSLA